MRMSRILSSSDWYDTCLYIVTSTSFHYLNTFQLSHKSSWTTNLHLPLLSSSFFLVKFKETKYIDQRNEKWFYVYWSPLTFNKTITKLVGNLPLQSVYQNRSSPFFSPDPTLPSLVVYLYRKIQPSSIQ